MTASHASSIRAVLAAHPRRVAAFVLLHTGALVLAIAAAPHSARDEAAAAIERATGASPAVPPVPALRRVPWPVVEFRHDPFDTGERAPAPDAGSDARSKTGAAADPR